MAEKQKPVLQDGYSEVADGRLAAVVTYLEMRSPPEGGAAADAAPKSAEMVRVENPDLEWYRALFAAVGREWLWFSRLRMSDAELRDTLNAQGVEIYLMRASGREAGFVELDFRVEGEVEVAFLGLLPEFTGSGLGSYLLGFAIERAWARKPRRLWLHTCTNDHPSALRFYIKHGFRPYRRAVEVEPDPRLTGELPMEAARHIPVIGAPVGSGGD